MSLGTLQEIERAIGALAPGEFNDLCLWLDQRYSQLVDARIQSDLAAGNLDAAIERALDDEKKGRVHLL